MAELPPAIEQADFLDIALRFSLACDSRSFRPDNADKFDPQWHLEVALQNVIEEPERTRLLQCLLGRDDLALQPSEDLQRRFFRAVGRQLHTFESWTMFHLQELMHWDGGMKRLKEGITSWTIPTLRCQMLPRKILLEPLLLAKKWGLHFENLAGKLPGSIWSCISSFLMPPSFSWFEAPKIRHAHPWWDWLRHPLVFPLFSSDSTSRNTFGKSVVGISMFLGEGSAEECMHRQQLVSLTLNDVRFIKQNASRKQLWDRLMMIVGNKVPTEEGRHVKPRHLPELSFADALLCLCIFMRLKHGIPVILLDFGSQLVPHSLEVLSFMLSRPLHVVSMTKDFDESIVNGPVNSLVTLRCNPDVWISRNGFLDSLQQFMRRKTIAPDTLSAARKAIRWPQQIVAVLRAEMTFNSLELLSTLPRDVRELVVPC